MTITVQQQRPRTRQEYVHLTKWNNIKTNLKPVNHCCHAAQSRLDFLWGLHRTASFLQTPLPLCASWCYHNLGPRVDLCGSWPRLPLAHVCVTLSAESPDFASCQLGEGVAQQCREQEKEEDTSSNRWENGRNRAQYPSSVSLQSFINNIVIFSNL